MRVEAVQLYMVSRFGSSFMTEFFGFPSKSSESKKKERADERGINGIFARGKYAG